MELAVGKNQGSSQHSCPMLSVQAWGPPSEGILMMKPAASVWFKSENTHCSEKHIFHTHTHTLSLIRRSKSPQRDVRHSISIQWTIEVLYSTVSFILHVLPRHSWSVRCILIWIQGNFHVQNLLPHVLTGYYTSFGDRSWCHHTSNLVLLPQYAKHKLQTHILGCKELFL